MLYVSGLGSELMKKRSGTFEYHRSVEQAVYFGEACSTAVRQSSAIQSGAVKESKPAEPFARFSSSVVSPRQPSPSPAAPA